MYNIYNTLINDGITHDLYPLDINSDIIFASFFIKLSFISVLKLHVIEILKNSLINQTIIVYTISNTTLIYTLLLW